MIHPLSEVRSYSIGPGTKIWQFVVVLENAFIGKNCNINSHVFIENNVIIGDHTTIKSGVQLWNGLRIGEGVFVGPNVTFTNDIYPRSKKYPDSFSKTCIERGASIGANATIVTDRSIGEFSMIGAGSVVTKDIPPYTIWYGNPAVHKGYITKEGTILSLNMKDKEGNFYEIINNKPVKK
ncbi:acyltransferase [Bacteroidetes bacterium endosymbiont of Geopemphigus sp.]|uniref:acyltransferase n=1 Tax=Bacteroidetes bacterium endosymbiont of Geopemphigus sp. TaxID=2047937 RepID=UPI000CCFF9BC|nr:acyltransferase [Bacteroidetes bacterium endosymbiont of Geopemphigus sp.]